MALYTPFFLEEVEKIKRTSQQQKDMKKLKLNETILKKTRDYNLAEYVPVVKKQKEFQTQQDRLSNGQKEQR